MTAQRYLPYDPVLPGLPDLFPASGAPEFVAEAASQLYDRPLDAASAEITYTRYWPRRRCVVQWTFPAPAGDIVISGELQPQGSKKHQGDYRGQLYLRDRSLLLQVFPFDDVLPGIEGAVSREWMDGTLAPALGLTRAEAATLTAMPTSYKSWRRCVVIYEAEVDGHRKRAYGKLFRDDRGAALYENLKRLESQLCDSGLNWGIASPLLYDPALRLLVQAEIVDGECLTDIARQAPEDLSRREDLLDTLRLAAGGLSHFQALDVPGLEDQTPAALLADLYADSEAIRRVDPELADSIKNRTEIAEKLIANLAPEPQGLAHSAFRLSHIFRRREGLSLIDLDALARAGISYDPGYFLAYLAVTGTERRRLRGALTQAAVDFAAGLNTPGRHDPRWLTFYAQAALLKWAVRSFYSLDPGWTDHVSDYIKIGRRMLASLDTSSEVDDPLLRVASSQRLLGELAREQVVPSFWPEAPFADLVEVDAIYEPGGECLYVAELEIGGRQGDKRVETLVFTFPAPEAVPAGPPPDAARRQRFSSPLGDYLAEVYPADYRLPGLQRVQAPQYFEGLLTGAGEVPAAGGRVESTLLRYRPHERAVLRCDYPDGRRYVAKIFDAPDNAEEVWHVLRAIRPQLADPSLVVRPVALDAENGLVLMEFIPGFTLGDLMDETLDEATMQRYTGIAAHVLAAVHGVEFQHESVKTHESEVKRLRRTAARLAEMAPDFAREVAGALDRADAIAIGLGRLEQPSIVHGGYKPTQLLINDGRPTLVDFDGTSLGDPGIDVGRFMAKLRADALDRPRRHLGSLPERFFEQYRKESKRDVGRAPLFEVNSLLRMAMRRFQTRPELLLDDDTSVAWTLLRQAQACLDRI